MGTMCQDVCRGRNDRRDRRRAAGREAVATSRSRRSGSRPRPARQRARKRAREGEIKFQRGPAERRDERGAAAERGRTRLRRAKVPRAWRLPLMVGVAELARHIGVPCIQDAVKLFFGSSLALPRLTDI